MRKRGLIIILFIALLPLMAYFLWFYRTGGLRSGFSSCFDSFSIDVNGKGKIKTVFSFTPEKYPNDHYVFLPSSALFPECGVYYSGADTLLLKSTEDGSSTALKSGGNLSSVEKNVIYEASFFSASGAVLESGKMMFKQSDNIAAVFVETESGGMDSIYADKEFRERGNIYIEDAEGAIEYMGSLKYIKGHGNTTWKEEKKSLGICLEDAAGLFGMSASYDWVLMANCMDETMMANTMVYDLARNAGMKYTAEMVYADLFLNGHYNGLYQIAEKNEVAPGRIEITDLNTKNKQANNAIDPSSYDIYSVNPGDPAERQAFLLPNNPVDITGGYLVEHDYGEKYDAEMSKFRTKRGDRYVLRSPAYASKEEIEYIAGIFDDLDKRASEGEDVSDLIDIKSFADKYILEEAVKNDGAGATSSYFYKDSDSVDPLIYAGPAWDYDMALGNSGRGLTDIPDHLDYCTNHQQHTLLFYDLYSKNSEFRECVKNEYRSTFRPLLIKLNEGGLREYAKAVDDNDEMNSDRWQINPVIRQEAMDRMETFLAKRVAFLDRVWLNDEELHTVHIEKDTSSRNPYIGVPDGGTMQILPLPRSKGDAEAYWVNKETGERFDENTPVYEDLTLTSSYYYDKDNKD